MKIATLSFYSGINKRGVERWTYDLANHLSGKFEMVVYQNGPSEPGAQYSTISLNLNFDVNRREILSPILKIPFLDYKSRRVAVFALKLLPKLWRENFDIIIPTDGGWEPAFIRILTWLRRKKMVIVGHAGIGWDDRNNIWCFPDCFVGLSAFASKWAKTVNPWIKTVLIPDGVDVQKFSPRGKKIALDLIPPVALYAGALEKSKRIDLIIKAVSKVRTLSLLIVGEGGEKERLEKLAAKFLRGRYKFLKYPFEKMPQVYRACDIFLSASIPYYSFEMVIAEAIATNLPVIANDDPIRKEIVGNAGYLTNPADSKKFSKIIEKALKANWGNKPRKQAKKFSWETIAQKYEELFQNLIS